MDVEQANIQLRPRLGLWWVSVRVSITNQGYDGVYSEQYCTWFLFKIKWPCGHCENKHKRNYTSCDLGRTVIAIPYLVLLELEGIFSMHVAKQMAKTSIHTLLSEYSLGGSHNGRGNIVQVLFFLWWAVVTWLPYMWTCLTGSHLMGGYV